MIDYKQEALDFLNECGSSILIREAGREIPTWDTKAHATYVCVITTPRSSMTVKFYDSAKNTDLLDMTVVQYAEQMFRMRYNDLRPFERIKAQTELKMRKAEAHPNAYDILTCLQKNEVDSMDDFMAEFGYEIKSAQDMTDFINTYNAVVNEYKDVRRCFTPEQIEKMREIQ